MCEKLNKVAEYQTCIRNRSHFHRLAMDQETLNMENFTHENVKNIKHMWKNNIHEVLYTENYSEQNQGT